MKYFAVSLLTFALGFSTNYLINKNSLTPKKVVAEQSGCPERQEVNEEIKVVKLQAFLNSSGCKLNDSKKEELNAVLKEVSTVSDSFKSSNDIESVVLPEGISSFQDNIELNIAEASVIAKLFELKEPELYFRSANIINKFDERIKKLNGRYYGKLYMKPYDHAPDDISLNIDFTKTNSGLIEGTLELILSRHGKDYSIKQRSTGNKDIRSDKKNRDSILIESSPRGFFHLNLKNISVLNYYYRGLHVGMAQIFRE